MNQHNYFFHNGFLVIKVPSFLSPNIQSVSNDYQMNDVLFARLQRRSLVLDSTNEQVKYIFIILSNNSHMIWANNLMSLFRKMVSDDTLYNDLFQAKTKSDIIQSLANTAVRIQLPVFLFKSFEV